MNLEDLKMTEDNIKFYSDEKAQLVAPGTSLANTEIKARAINPMFLQ